MSIPNGIPFLDLVTPHLELETELVDAFRQALHSAGFVGGAPVEEFEHAFATFCDAKHAIAVNSGTDALRFALMACGVKSGDVVVTVPHTFIATSEAISQTGATPEFIDIAESTYNLSAEALRFFLGEHCYRNTSGQTISKRHNRPVTAVVPVHLYGQMADLDPIVKLCEEYGLVLIEDACQAHGAKYFSAASNRWLTAGSVGRAAAFSFYPGKNLGACGEGGAVTTQDAVVASRIRMIRDHGQASKYYHDIEGYNGRLDAIQASILKIKLSHLGFWNEQRRERASEYNRLFSTNKAVCIPLEPENSRGVYHLYVIRVNNRDGLISYLRERGIGTGIHYPIPLHLQKAYAAFNYSRGDFPVAERVSNDIVSLPMFPTLTGAQQMRVVEEVGQFTSSHFSSRMSGSEQVLVPAK